MSAAAAPTHDPLLLRLLLQVVRPRSLRFDVHRWMAVGASFIYAYVLWGAAYLHSWRVFVGGSLVVLTIGVVFTAVSNHLTARVYRRYPEPAQAGRRLRLMSLAMVLMGGTTTVVTLAGFEAVHLLGYRYNPTTGPWILLTAILADLILVGFYEILFAFEQWQTNQLESEQLERQLLQGQLNEIKQRVNPHFLFNSLSSLSVLIGEDPARAERFVDEMAKVYRYLLQAHRSSELPAPAALVPLAAELRFLQSYAHLLRTRYGAGLVLHVATADDCPTGALLPLTLQTLVDNAIRHNALSASRPLHLDIVASDCYVHVRNTRQPRTVRVAQPAEGLAELQARYRLLGPAHHLQIQADGEQFSVAVPLVTA